MTSLSHDKELERRELEMSEKVDKATYRALVAEKKLNENSVEKDVACLEVLTVFLLYQELTGWPKNEH